MLPSFLLLSSKMVMLPWGGDVWFRSLASNLKGLYSSTHISLLLNHLFLLVCSWSVHGCHPFSVTGPWNFFHVLLILWIFISGSYVHELFSQSLSFLETEERVKHSLTVLDEQLRVSGYCIHCGCWVSPSLWLYLFLHVASVILLPYLCVVGSISSYV
jgi:hypothetical protein